MYCEYKTHTRISQPNFNSIQRLIEEKKKIEVPYSVKADSQKLVSQSKSAVVMLGGAVHVTGTIYAATYHDGYCSRWVLFLDFLVCS